MVTTVQFLRTLQGNQRVDGIYDVLERSRQLINGMRVETIYIPPELFLFLKGERDYDPTWRGIRIAPSVHEVSGTYEWLGPLEYDISGDFYVYCNRDGDLVSIGALQEDGIQGSAIPAAPSLPPTPSFSSFSGRSDFWEAELLEQEKRRQQEKSKTQKPKKPTVSRVIRLPKEKNNGQN